MSSGDCKSLRNGLPRSGAAQPDAALRLFALQGSDRLAVRDRAVGSVDTLFEVIAAN